MMSSLLSPWLFSTESVFPPSDYCSLLLIHLDTHTNNTALVIVQTTSVTLWLWWPRTQQFYRVLLTVKVTKRHESHLRTGSSCYCFLKAGIVGQDELGAVPLRDQFGCEQSPNWAKITRKSDKIFSDSSFSVVSSIYFVYVFFMWL